MTGVTITVHCCMCSARTEHVISLPIGWAHQYDAIEDEAHGFCPQHAAIKPFTDAQCPGCVGGWGDCGLWDAFAYDRRRTIGDAQLATLRTGVCPYRVNGSMEVNRADAGATIIDIDMSSPEAASGAAVAAAIIEYISRYGG